MIFHSYRAKALRLIAYLTIFVQFIDCPLRRAAGKPRQGLNADACKSRCLTAHHMV